MKSVAGSNMVGAVYPIRAQLSLNSWQRVSASKTSANLVDITRYTTIRLTSESVLSSSLKNANVGLKKK